MENDVEELVADELSEQKMADEEPEDIVGDPLALKIKRADV